MSQPVRSVLFLSAQTPPGDLAGLTGEADALILDLEDLVAESARGRAREALPGAVEAAPRGALLYVRVNGLETPHCLDDLEQAVGSRLAGVVFPKIASTHDLATADWALAQVERRAGLDAGGLELLAIVETARAVTALPTFAAHAVRRPVRLGLGIGDLGAELDVTVGAGEEELIALRTQLVVASRAAGFAPPVDAVHLDTSDEAGTARSAERARRHGFAGKFCLSASQAAVVNAAFRPSAREVAAARALLDAYEAAVAAGEGAAEVDGTFVDAPVAVRLRKVLEAAR